MLQHGVTCLTELDQSPPKTMLDSMQSFLKAIVKPGLLKHHDREVNLFVAACLCEITRITAPEAPYEDDIMKVRLSFEEEIANQDDISSLCLVFKHVYLCLDSDSHYLIFHRTFFS